MALVTSLLCFKTDGFEDLPSKPGESTFSDMQTTCDGNVWNLKLKPGGDINDADAEDNINEDSPWLSVYLCRKGKHDMKVNFFLIL